GFFFQAEDGIRDGHVTGVQTCALPIYSQTAAAIPSSALAVPASLHASLMARLDRLGPAKEVAQIGAVIGREFSHALLAAVVRKRSEERRVGKECRSGMSLYPYKRQV